MGHKTGRSLFNKGAAAIATGRISVSRGRNKDYGHIVLWDHIPDCRGVDCPAYRPCHWKTKDEPGSKCYAVQGYLRTVVDKIFKSIGKELSEIQKMQVGLELVPLYRNLIKLKLAEIGVTGMTYTTPKGMLAVHPVYKEIRETIKMIESVLGTIGIREMDAEIHVQFSKGYVRDPSMPRAKVLPTARSYYEMLESSGAKNLNEEEKVVELKRRAAE